MSNHGGPSTQRETGRQPGKRAGVKKASCGNAGCAGGSGPGPITGQRIR